MIFKSFDYLTKYNLIIALSIFKLKYHNFIWVNERELRNKSRGIKTQ